MLTKRQKDVLKIIVDEFVATAEPVGSKTLVDKYGLPYSSATIRNEMAYLEEIGLLEKTHTSSGRIPSSEGYRYYVEYIMDPEVNQDYELVISSMFESNQMNLNEIIKRSSDIISEMTKMTSIVLGPEADAQRLEHIKLFPLDSKSAVAVFITDTGHTENKVFLFEENVSVEDIKVTTDILNDRLTGTLIRDVADKMDAIKPVMEEAVVRHELLFNAFLGAFVKFASQNVYFSGERNLFYQPEFSDIDRLRELMLMMDNHQIWRNISEGDVDLILETSDHAQLAWVDDLAIISSTLDLANDEEAKILLIGPSRMDYQKVLSLVESLNKTIQVKQIKGGNHEREE